MCTIMHIETRARAVIPTAGLRPLSRFFSLVIFVPSSLAHPTGALDPWTPWIPGYFLWSSQYKPLLLDKVRRDSALSESPLTRLVGCLPGRVVYHLARRLPSHGSGRLPGHVPGYLPARLPGRLPSHLPGNEVRRPTRGEAGRLLSHLPSRLQGRVAGRLPGHLSGHLPDHVVPCVRNRARIGPCPELGAARSGRPFCCYDLGREAPHAFSQRSTCRSTRRRHIRVPL